MRYLIMKCEELGDQWECDAARSPITMTDNWKDWYDKTHPDYWFEVYKYDEQEGEFTLIKEYEDTVEEGMTLAYYDDDSDKAIPIKKFPNLTRYNEVPPEVASRIKEGTDLDNSLNNCGYISWMEDEVLHCWTEYTDNIIYNCF